MMLFGREDVGMLWLLLLLALGLTFTESRELKLDWRHTIWWLSFVAITHVVGYLIMRGWSFWLKRNQTQVA